MTIQARAIEAIVGAGLGGAAGALGGGAAYEPKAPRVTMDERGLIHERSLTSKEQAQKGKASRKAALLGALMGAGGSLGVSGIRRSNITKKEGEAVEALVGLHTEGLKKNRDELAKTLRAIGEDKKNRVFRPSGALKKELKATAEVLRSERKELRGLKGVAEENRNAAPWGGWFHDVRSVAKDKPLEKIPSRTKTHEGLVANRYAKLREEFKLPAFDEGPTGREAMGEGFYREMVKKWPGKKKTASAQYLAIWGI